MGDVVHTPVSFLLPGECAICLGGPATSCYRGFLVGFEPFKLTIVDHISMAQKGFRALGADEFAAPWNAGQAVQRHLMIKPIITSDCV
jgi:hypothetical protein